MGMDKSIEPKTRSPRVREVVYVHAVVAAGLTLAPEEKRVFCRFLFWWFIFFVLDGEF